MRKLAKNADSITCCLSKGLSSPAGSLIMGNKGFIYKARYIRKALGGGMRQGGIIAAAGIISLKNRKDGFLTAFYEENKYLSSTEIDNYKEIVFSIINEIKDAVYTRYADDLTFSFNNRSYHQEIQSRVTSIVESFGFTINTHKEYII